MNRGAAFVLLLIIVLGCGLVASTTSATSLLNSTDSPMVFTYEGHGVTLAAFCWVALGIVGWLILVLLGFTIDPYLGELIFRIGLWCIVVWIDKDFDVSPSRNGGGSGNSNRVG